VQLVLARSDIRAALSACEQLLKLPEKNPQDDLFQALQYAMIVSYGRPFTQTRKGSVAALPEKYERFESARYRQLHAELLELRHQAVAHSDLRSRAVLVIPPGGAPPGGRTVDRPSTAVTVHGIDPEVLPEARALCNEVGVTLSLDAEVLLQELYVHADLPPEGLVIAGTLRGRLK
jgi:hypothetical protein